MLYRRNHVTNCTLSQHMIRLLFICLITATLYPSVGHTSTDNNARQLHIYTAIAPLAFIIEQIGGSHLTVETLLPRGQDPHLFEPGPRLLHKLSKADIYLMSGLPFERLLIKKITTSHKKLTIINVTKQISFWESDHYLDGHDYFDNDTDAHDHAQRDPHFWLGVQQLHQFITAAARSIRDADPTHAATYHHNTARLLARLNSVHARNQTLLRPYRNRIFFAYHPAFGYFARTYELRQHTVEINGRQPGPRSIAVLVKQARAADVRTIFVQPQYDTKGAQAIATAINGSVMPLDPLAKDVIQNLETMAQIIARSFMQEPSQP